MKPAQCWAAPRGALGKASGTALLAVLALLAGCQTSGGPPPTASGSAPQRQSAAAPAPAGGGLSAVLGSLGAAAPNSPVRDILEGASASLKDYTAEEQRALGTEFSAVLLGARPLLRNDVVQRYVNQVGTWVAAQAEKPKDKDGREISFAWRFGVIDSEGVNAYATPGGFVYVTVGLLKRLNSEAELAGVLGHEVAHVVRGHYLAALRKGGFSQIAGGVVRARTGNNAISSAMVSAVRDIYSKGLDRTDEFDADRQGMLYAARAGYAPAGLPNVLRMFAASGTPGDANFQVLFNTHPNPNDRMAQVQPLVGTKFARAAQVTNEARYQAVKKLLR